MTRGEVVVASTVVGAILVVLAARVWRLHNVRTAPTISFTSKYAVMLQDHKRRQQGSGEYCEEGARVMVIYGSSSGNSESHARSLVDDLRERGVVAELINPSSWDYLSHYTPYLQQQQQEQQQQQPLFPSRNKDEPPIVVFIVSTTGEGEVPANFACLFAEMQAAVQRISQRGAKPFDGLLYAVFALGDKSYKYYCRGGLDVNMLLKQGGAKELLPVGFGDARNPLWEDLFEEWEEKLMEALEQKCGVVLTAGLDVPPKPRLAFRFAPEKSVDVLPYPPPPSLLEPTMQCPAQLRVQAKTPRTERRDDGSFILQLVLSLDGYTVSYQAGDHLGIYPINPPDVVEAYRKVLNIAMKEWLMPVELCTVTNARARASLKNTFPARVPLKTVFEHYLDLCGRPRRSMLRALVKYCSDPEEKKGFSSLIQRSAKENGEKLMATPPLLLSSSFSPFSSSSRSQYRNLLDYLMCFPSCCSSLPVGHFLEMMPRMQPRFYSIASDMMTHPTTVEVFIRITPDGLNSRYLQRIPVGEKVTAFIRKSTFHLPTKNSERPVIMISAGTGVASMLGFCYRRAALMKKRPGATYGPMIFFFGAQRRSTEYFVRQELEGWCLHGEGTCQATDASPPSLLTLLDLAFSRDQPEKYYVTHLIEKHKDYILQLLTLTANGGCLLYLSGDASHLAKSVDQALLKVLQYGAMTHTAARDFLRRMEQERRYMKDVY